MTQRPDTERRVLVATIVLILLLSWINGVSVWAFAESPLP